MRRIFPLVIALVIIFGLTVTGRADLIDMKDGTVYDTDTQLTWLKDANYAETSGYNINGLTPWNEAKMWVGNLVFAGFDNWRLPKSVPNPEGPNITTYNMTGSEMGHLYYIELDNEAAMGGPASQLKPGPFINVIQSGYWSETPVAGYADRFWVFNFSGGGQGAGWTEQHCYVWPVREGERSVPTPEPGILILLGISMASIVGLKGWWRQ